MNHPNPHHARRWLILAIPGVAKPMLIPGVTDASILNQALTELSPTADLGLAC